jgi:hypothetical protein
MENVGAILNELATFQWTGANVAWQLLIAGIADTAVQAVEEW